MTDYPTFSQAEETIIYETALAGKSGHAVAEALKAAGFERYVASVTTSKPYRRALAELREAKAAKATKHSDTECVVYGDLVLRREVRTITTQTLNGLSVQMPVSLSAGVGWQA